MRALTRGRVAREAVVNVLAPLLDRRFHPDSYARRAGKGTYAAARRLQQLMGRYPFPRRADGCRFFPSIDHNILEARFRRLVKDRRCSPCSTPSWTALTHRTR